MSYQQQRALGTTLVQQGKTRVIVPSSQSTTRSASMPGMPSWVPASCATIGPEFASQWKSPPNPVPVGTIIVGAASIGSRDLTPAQILDAKAVARQTFRGTSGSVTGTVKLGTGISNAEYLLSGYVDHILYVVYRVLTAGPLSSFIRATNIAGEKMTRAAGLPIAVSLPIVSPNDDQLSIEIAARIAGGAATDAVAAIARTFLAVVTPGRATQTFASFRAASGQIQTLINEAQQAPAFSAQVVQSLRSFLDTAEQTPGIDPSTRIADVKRALSRIKSMLLTGLSSFDGIAFKAVSRSRTIAEELHRDADRDAGRVSGTDVRAQWMRCSIYKLAGQNAIAWVPELIQLGQVVLPPLEVQLKAVVPPAVASLDEALEQTDQLAREFGLGWWSKKFGPLPVWAWGAIGGVALIGVAVVFRKKKPVVALPAKSVKL